MPGKNLSLCLKSALQVCIDIYILNLFRYFAGRLHYTMRRHNLFQNKHKILELAKQMVVLTRAGVLGSACISFLVLLASRTAAHEMKYWLHFKFAQITTILLFIEKQYLFSSAARDIQNDIRYIT
jgi:hypothetical protein